MSAGDRSAARIIAGVLASERARRTGGTVHYDSPGILDLAEDIVAELARYNGSDAKEGTVIFTDGALGYAHDMSGAGYGASGTIHLRKA